MDTKETKLTVVEREKLAFIVGAFAHRLSQEERDILSVSIEQFARVVASRVYINAEIEGMKKAFQRAKNDPSNSS